MFRPFYVQMQKCSTVQIFFYCEGGGASDLGDRCGHWQNVHIRLEAPGQPLNFGNCGGSRPCAKKVLSVAFVGCCFTLSRMFFFSFFTDDSEQKSYLTRVQNTYLLTDIKIMSSIKCHLTSVTWTKFGCKKRLRERQARNFGCVDHGQSESAARGYRGVQLGYRGVQQTKPESNPRPRAYPQTATKPGGPWTQ